MKQTREGMTRLPGGHPAEQRPFGSRAHLRKRLGLRRDGPGDVRQAAGLAPEQARLGVRAGTWGPRQLPLPAESSGAGARRFRNRAEAAFGSASRGRGPVNEIQVKRRLQEMVTRAAWRSPFPGDARPASESPSPSVRARPLPGTRRPPLGEAGGVGPPLTSATPSRPASPQGPAGGPPCAIESAEASRAGPVTRGGGCQGRAAGGGAGAPIAGRVLPAPQRPLELAAARAEANRDAVL